MIIYSIMAIFFWESRNSIKGGGIEVGFIELLFVLYFLKGIIQKAESTFFLIIIFTSLRVLGLILAFTSSRHYIKPMEDWHLLMFIPLILIALISFKVIKNDFAKKTKEFAN